MFIIDIGANRGLFTDKCLSLFNDDLTILVIEANPKLSGYLTDKYKNNIRVTVLNNLISENDGDMIDFFISNVDTISTASKQWVNESRFTNQFRWFDPIKIMSRSLDSLINEYGEADLIKIDVEGYEFEVLKGLTKKTKDICFEWAEEQYVNINKTAEHLKNLGYDQFGFILGDEYMKKPEIYSNWENCEIHKNIKEGRKETWGMIWVR